MFVVQDHHMHDDHAVNPDFRSRDISKCKIDRFSRKMSNRCGSLCFMVSASTTGECVVGTVLTVGSGCGKSLSSVNAHEPISHLSRRTYTLRTSSSTYGIPMDNGSIPTELVWFQFRYLPSRDACGCWPTDFSVIRERDLRRSCRRRSSSVPRISGEITEAWRCVIDIAFPAVSF